MSAIATRDRISEELAPYFKYATNENFSRALNRFTDPDGTERCHLIYQNCVSCNSPRFTLDELTKRHIGVSTYMCPECSASVINKFKNYTYISLDSSLDPSEEERTAFDKLWNDHLFAHKPSSS